MLKKLHQAEGGFTLVELLVTIAILGVLFGIVSLTLTGVGSNAQTTVCAAELGVVQSAIDIYMAVGNLPSLPPAEVRTVAAVINGEADALFSTYLRHMPTTAQYTWTAAGIATQASAAPCP